MPKRYSSRELIRMIEADGWVLVGVKGDHHQFKHPTKPGRVTIPHPQGYAGRHGELDLETGEHQMTAAAIGRVGSGRRECGSEL